MFLDKFNLSYRVWLSIRLIKYVNNYKMFYYNFFILQISHNTTYKFSKYFETDAE